MYDVGFRVQWFQSPRRLNRWTGGGIAKLAGGCHSSGEAVKFDPRQVLGPYGRAHEPTRHSIDRVEALLLRDASGCNVGGGGPS